MQVCNNFVKSLFIGISLVSELFFAMIMQMQCTYYAAVLYVGVRCPVFDRTVRFFGDLSGQIYDVKPNN